MKKPETIGFLLSFSVPGSTWMHDLSEEEFNDHPFVKLRRALEKFNIPYKCCDTLPSWWDLNQDWLQLYVPERAMIQHYRIGFSEWWPDILRQYLQTALDTGKIILVVHQVQLSRNFPRKNKTNFQEEIDRILFTLNSEHDNTLFKKYGLKFLDWV